MWKRPPLRATGLPARPSGNSGSPSPGVTPHPSPFCSPGIPPSLQIPQHFSLGAQERLPLEFLHLPTLLPSLSNPHTAPHTPHPVPAPTPGTAPDPHSTAAPPPYLAATAAGPQPSSCRQEPAWMPAVPSHLSPPHPPCLSPAPPRAQSFPKRNEHRPARAEKRELESPQRGRPPYWCGALREHAQQRPTRGGRAHPEAVDMLVRGAGEHAHQRPARRATRQPPAGRALGARQPCFCWAVPTCHLVA